MSNTCSLYQVLLHGSVFHLTSKEVLGR